MYFLFSEIVKVMVIYKRTLCRSVRFVVIFVVDKLDSRCAVVQFCQSFVNHTQNWTPLGPITIINRVFSFFQWWLLTILCIPPRKRVISRGRLLFMTRWTKMRRGRLGDKTAFWFARWTQAGSLRRNGRISYGIYLTKPQNFVTAPKPQCVCVMENRFQCNLSWRLYV